MTVAINEAEERVRQRCTERLRELTREDLEALRELLDILASPDCGSPEEVSAVIAEILLPERQASDPDDEEEELQAKHRVAEYRKKVGVVLRKARQAKHLTQEQLATAAGLPQTHISRLETGKHAPTYLTIERLAAALDMTPKMLDPGFED